MQPTEHAERTEVVGLGKSPKRIWLSPICDDVAHHGEGRLWASPAPAATCEDCPEPWVEYVRADLAAGRTIEPRAEVGRLIAAVDAWIADPDPATEQGILDARAALNASGENRP